MADMRDASRGSSMRTRRVSLPLPAWMGWSGGWEPSKVQRRAVVRARTAAELVTPQAPRLHVVTRRHAA
jgi:hypothetical protein